MASGGPGGGNKKMDWVNKADPDIKGNKDIQSQNVL